MTTPRPSRARASAILGLAVLAWLGPLGPAILAGCSLLWRSSDLANQVAAARTPADHAAIARSMLAKAEEYKGQARYHRCLADEYENEALWAWYRHHDRSGLRLAEHCRRIADDLEQAASELTQLAQEHERLARELQEDEE